MIALFVNNNCIYTFEFNYLVRNYNCNVCK